MLDNIFKTVLNLTITSSIVALIILMVRFFFSRFIPKRIIYVLWLVLLMRLVIPFSFSTDFSMFNVVPTPVSTQKVYTNEYIKLDTVKPSYPKINIELSQRPPVNTTSGLKENPNSVNTIRIIYFTLSVVWALGALLILFFTIIGYVKFRSKLKTAYLYKNSRLIKASKDRINFKKDILVLLSEHIKSPIVCGLISPKIILPVFCENQDESELEKILVHELFHIKRFDNVFNMLFLLAVCIHFFNPIIWLCYLLFKKDMELSCDEKVISIFGNSAKSHYANALINFSVRQNGLLRGGILSFGESNIKSRIKGIMNFKKKSRIITAFAVIVVIFIAIATLTNGNKNKPINTPINNASDLALLQSPDSISDSLYGGIQTPFSDFRITPDIDSDNYPVIFKMNGNVGYKDKTGNIIVEAIYGSAQDFWKGIGRVRIDKDGGYTWKTIDVKGNLLDYDNVDGFTFGLSPVSKDGKYGFINTADELVVPLIYDKLYCSYTNDARSTYGVKDGKFVYLNLTEGYEEVFEKYNPDKKSEYKNTINLKDYNIAIANGMLIVNGVSQPSRFDIPIYILENLDFGLYTQSKKLGTYKAKLTPGPYDGEIFVTFPEYDKTLPEDTHGDYYAVLSSSNISYPNVTKLAEPEKYIDMVKGYLNDNKIENTPFSIDIAFEGDFSGKGTTGVVLEINDMYRKGNGEEPKPFKEGWSEKKFADNKTAFVNAILIIDDINKPLEYRIVKSNIWTHISQEYETEHIRFIANFDSDNGLELLILNGSYEYLDYAIVDL